MTTDEFIGTLLSVYGYNSVLDLDTIREHNAFLKILDKDFDNNPLAMLTYFIQECDINTFKELKEY